MEIFTDVLGYENLYEVSTLGRIRNKIKGNFLIPGLSSRKYLTLGLYKDGIRKTNTVHRIVFTSFNKDLDITGIVVDHINNIKTDNFLSNLQAITIRENNSKDKSDEVAPLGVHYLVKRDSYVCFIFIDGCKIYLGYGKDKNKLGNAYNTALKNSHLFKGDDKLFKKAIEDLLT